jgi:hypothetical protein
MGGERFLAGGDKPCRHRTGGPGLGRGGLYARPLKAVPTSESLTLRLFNIIYLNAIVMLEVHIGSGTPIPPPLNPLLSEE